MQPPDATSTHPIGRLIVRLIREEVEPSPGDLDRIVQRIASAPFNRRPVRVPARDRGLAYGEIVLGRTSDSLAYHLVKRIRGERQWADGTTIHDYLPDLQAAVQYPGARLLAYERSGGIFVATMSPTTAIVPAERLGHDWLPHLLVVYSVEHAMVTTGYMFSSFETINFPEAIRWLR